MKVYTNVDEVISNLKLFSAKIDAGLNNSVADLGKHCKDIAKANVIIYDKDPFTGEQIKNNIKLSIENKMGGNIRAVVEAGHQDSKFYEYGTGIVGSESPHPESEKAGWEYNLSTIYKRISSISGREGWFHNFPIGVRFTSGQPASAFMFKAYSSTRAKAQSLLKEKFNDALKGG